MHKRFLGTILAVAMVSGLLLIGAAPAQAAPPTGTQNFLPDNTTPSGGDGSFLSDKNDGVDQAAHLTNVSTADTAEVRWFACPEDRFGPGGVVDDNNDLNGCTALGTDATPTSPEDGPGTPPVPDADEAYELFFDIPPALDNDIVDIVAAASINAAACDFVDDAPAGGANDERNCTADVEDNITLDDASQGIQGAQTSAGEITGFCAVDPASDDDCRLEDGTDAGTEPDPDPAVDANFQPLPHGSNVPNDRFTIRVSTSLDVAVVQAGLSGPTDATTETNTGSFPVCEEISRSADSRVHQCTFTSVPDNTELELSAYEITTDPGVGGNCTSATFNCELDAHYVVSQDRRPGAATVSFKREGSSTNDRDISLSAGCNSPDVEDTNRTFNASHLVGCLEDQFGAPIANQPTTFESTGVGEFLAFNADCTVDDHDDDGLAQACHSNSGGGDGEYDAEIFSDVAGDQNVTFCFDEENSTANPAVANHGCADETISATLVKHWQGFPDNITLVFDDGAATPDPCEGLTNKNNRVGQSDELVACVTDDNGDPISTLDEDNGSLQWFIEQGADDFTDTRFASPPPQETDAAGQARATIEAVDPGTDNIRVELLDEEGDLVDSAVIQKQVEPRPGGTGRARSSVSIRHRTGPHRFTGHVSSPRNSCERNRTVVVRRRVPGNDKVIGRDRVNRRGNYVIRHRRTSQRQTYYARVLRNADCRADNSRNIRRR